LEGLSCSSTVFRSFHDGRDDLPLFAWLALDSPDRGVVNSRKEELLGYYDCVDLSRPVAPISFFQDLGLLFCVNVRLELSCPVEFSMCPVVVDHTWPTILYQIVGMCLIWEIFVVLIKIFIFVIHFCFDIDELVARIALVALAGTALIKSVAARLKSDIGAAMQSTYRNCVFFVFVFILILLVFVVTPKVFPLSLFIFSIRVAFLIPVNPLTLLDVIGVGCGSACCSVLSRRNVIFHLLIIIVLFVCIGPP